MKLELHHGFSLLKDIIHIFAPIYTQEHEPIEKLKESYIDIFNVIKKEKYKSVVIPSIGTGFHCYIHTDVAEIVIKLINEFCKNNDVVIIFNLYDEETAEIYKKYL